jgi:hypothetical protein
MEVRCGSLKIIRRAPDGSTEKRDLDRGALVAAVEDRGTILLSTATGANFDSMSKPSGRASEDPTRRRTAALVKPGADVRHWELLVLRLDFARFSAVNNRGAAPDSGATTRARALALAVVGVYG